MRFVQKSVSWLRHNFKRFESHVNGFADTSWTIARKVHSWVEEIDRVEMTQ